MKNKSLNVFSTYCQVSLQEVYTNFDLVFLATSSSVRKTVITAIAATTCGKVNFFWLYIHYLIKSLNSPKFKWNYPHVMANFMSIWLDHSAQIFKHYAVCLCDDFFWITLTFKLVDFEQGKLPSIMRVGLIQTVEGLNRTKADFLWARRNSASRHFLDLNCDCFPGLQPVGLLHRFWTYQGSTIM